jgi:hypothetical protein
VGADAAVAGENLRGGTVISKDIFLAKPLKTIVKSQYKNHP